MEDNLNLKIKNLKLRAKIIQLIRDFFVEQNYFEVETPIRILAPAPEANIDAQPSGEWFLQTSPELCMKRLLASEFTSIFQICKCFRQLERSEKHIPEFTMLEWYKKDTDYLFIMDECESLIQYIAKNFFPENNFEYQDIFVNLTSPWEKITVSKAFKKFSPITMEKALKEDSFDEIISFEIEPKLAKNFNKPVFLYDYPKQYASLAKLKSDNSEFAERFELYIAGMEICNAFSELTDPFEQRLRFDKEIILRKKSGKSIYPIDEKFLNNVKNIGKASGNALGIDRLAMLFCNAKTIDEIVAFTPEEL